MSSKIAVVVNDLTAATADPNLDLGPFRDKLEHESFYESLDDGIRFAVRVLHAANIDTCQSCEGGKGHSYDHPSIDLPATDRNSDGFAALAALESYGLTVSQVSIVWPVHSGMPYEKLWRLELVGKCTDRADEIPNFIYSYRAAGKRV